MKDGFPFSPGHTRVQEDLGGICCLFQADALNPAKFVAGEKALREADVAEDAPIFLAGKQIGRIHALSYGWSERRLFAHCYFDEDAPKDFSKTVAAAIVKPHLGIQCPVCETLFFEAREEACPCIYRSPVIVLRRIFVESVRLLDGKHEDINGDSVRSEFLTRQFAHIVDSLQLTDPI